MNDFPWSDGPEIEDLDSADFESLLPDLEELLDGIERYPDIEVSRHRTSKTGWTFDSAGFYAYVLVDGDRRYFETAVDRLRAHPNIAVLTAGRSFRTDSKGKQHDWYIRVSAPGGDGRHPAEADVRAAMGSATLSADTTPESTSAEAPKSAVSNQLIAERARGRDLDRELQTVTAELSRFKASYNRLLDQISTNQADYEAQLEKIDRRVEEIRSETQSDSEAATTVQELQTEIESLEAARRRDLDYFNHIATENGDLEKMIAEKETKIGALYRELDLLTTKGEIEATSGVGQGRLPGENDSTSTIVDRETFLAMFPETYFVNGSIDMIYNEISDMADVLVKLSELNRTGRLGKAKGVTSVSGWYEVHLRTGTNITARLYYRNRNAELSVLVSDKRSQKLDVRRLRKL
jgi:hypothetical protein